MLLKDSVLGDMATTAMSRGSNSGLEFFLSNRVLDNANVAMFQMTVDLPGTYDLVFLSGDQSDASISSRVQALSGRGLSKLLGGCPFARVPPMPCLT